MDKGNVKISNGEKSNGDKIDGESSNDEHGNHERSEAERPSTHAGDDEKGTVETPPEPRLLYSKRIGFPPYVLDPKDLDKAQDLCPDKMGPRIVEGEEGTLVKFGLGVRLAEAEAMHFIAEETSIKLPRLEAAYTLDGITYIVMSYEDGVPLNTYWDSTSEAQHTHVLDQLKDYVQQMQAISGSFIGSVDESYCEDGVFSAWGSESLTYGPFDNESAFNEGIIQALRNRLAQPEAEPTTRDHFLHATVRSLKDHAIVFCHADLHPSNMLVKDDGTVILLDWGCAGFWPAYWEWYRVMATYAWKASWHLEMEKCVPPFHIECMVMEKVANVVWN